MREKQNQEAELKENVCEQALQEKDKEQNELNPIE